MTFAIELGLLGRVPSVAWPDDVEHRLTSPPALTAAAVTARAGVEVLDFPKAAGWGVRTTCNVALAVVATQDPHQRLSVGVGWAIPDREGVPGYASEVEGEQGHEMSAEACADDLGAAAVRLLAE